MSRNGFQYAKYFGEYDEYRNTGEPRSRRVSIDATFYPLPTASRLGTYLSQIPVDVEMRLRCRKSSPVRSMRSMPATKHKSVFCFDEAKTGIA